VTGHPREQTSQANGQEDMTRNLQETSKNYNFIIFLVCFLGQRDFIKSIKLIFFISFIRLFGGFPSFPSPCARRGVQESLKARLAHWQGKAQ